MKNHWYIKLPTGRELGPLTEVQCKDYLKKLPTLDSYWVKQGSSNWKNASEVKQLFDQLENYGFYLRRDKEIFGPFTSAKLKEMIDQGIKDIEVRPGRSGKWLTLEYFLNFSNSVFQNEPIKKNDPSDISVDLVEFSAKENHRARQRTLPADFGAFIPLASYKC